MFTQTILIVACLGVAVAGGQVQNAGSTGTPPAYAPVSPLMAQEQQEWLTAADVTAQRQREALEARYSDAMDALKSDIMCQIERMPFAEKTIWAEYFSLVGGVPWSQISLDNTAGNELVHIRAWKLRNQLLDDYFTQRMVDIVLSPVALSTLESAIDNKPAARRLQVRGSDLYNYMQRCQFEKGRIDSERASALLAVERQRHHCVADAEAVADYRGHRPAERPAVDVTAISVGRGGPTAMVNGVLVKEGETAGKIKVTRIGLYEIEYEMGGTRSVIKLATESK